MTSEASVALALLLVAHYGEVAHQDGEIAHGDAQAELAATERLDEDLRKRLPKIVREAIRSVKHAQPGGPGGRSRRDTAGRRMRSHGSGPTR
jgi:hypothetical protein